MDERNVSPVSTECATTDEALIDLRAAAHVALMRKKEVLKVLQFSKATLHRKIRAGIFPAPIRISDRIVAWRRTEIYEWISKQERA
jgi:predicted DNA-binding transcriptional regulator AlpA